MDKFRSSELFSSSEFTLVAVESVEYRRRKTNTGYQFFGTIAPVAVIVCGSDLVYALDMEAMPINIEQLKRDIPGLDAIVT